MEHPRDQLVEIYGEHRLDDYDSGVTVPEVLDAIAPVRAGDCLEFVYELGRRPGLRVEKLPPPTDPIER